MAERIGDRGFMPRMLNTLGWLHIECDDVERGIDVTARAAAFARDIRHAFGVEMYTFCTVNLGDAFLAKGDLVLAGEKFDEARRIAEDPKTHEWMKWRYTLHLHASLGEYWLARGDHRRAAEFARAFARGVAADPVAEVRRSGAAAPRRRRAPGPAVGRRRARVAGVGRRRPRDRASQPDLED